VRYKKNGMAYRLLDAMERFFRYVRLHFAKAKGYKITMLLWHHKNATAPPALFLPMPVEIVETK